MSTQVDQCIEPVLQAVIQQTRFMEKKTWNQLDPIYEVTFMRKQSVLL
jgi:hypothetical protein